MSLPFGGVLAAAVLLAPARWRSTVLAASLGSSFGALVIYLVFHHLGWNQFIAVYPDIVASQAWIDANRWLSGYGMFALFAIAALPVPQTPALIFTAIYRLPVGEVWLAIFAGKLVKYGVYALGVKAFPDRFAGRYEALLPRMRRAP